MRKIAMVDEFFPMANEALAGGRTLVCGEKEDKVNFMTISWGCFGTLWNKPVFLTFIRPSRHTYSFVEASEAFSVNFFSEDYKRQMTICGTKSGRDIDKLKECDFEIVKTEDAAVIQEAEFSFICKKLAFIDMKKEDLPQELVKNFYADNSFHRIYVGEIIDVYQKA